MCEWIGEKMRIKIKNELQQKGRYTLNNGISNRSIEMKGKATFLRRAPVSAVLKWVFSSLSCVISRSSCLEGFFHFSLHHHHVSLSSPRPRQCSFTLFLLYPSSIEFSPSSPLSPFPATLLSGRSTSEKKDWHRFGFNLAPTRAQHHCYRNRQTDLRTDK